MDQMETRGLLVVVEGVDGAGKSTVLKRLAAHCSQNWPEVVTSREPTTGPHGRRIRESAVSGRLPLEEELDLFLRDRREHVDTLIAPALSRGALVLLDRYYFSTAAYQGARGADPRSILAANEAFAPAPDLVLLLDCPPAVTLERIRSRGGGADAFEGLEALEAVRSIFLSLEHPSIRLVDATQSPEVVSEECTAFLEALLQGRLSWR